MVKNLYQVIDVKEVADWIKGEEVLTAAEKRLNMCERDKG